VSSFVDECRREWNRLGVRDAIANEMAAELTADLAEAEAEGVSPEEVVGNDLFDPRSFAAAWAEARGVVRSQPTKPRFRRRPVLPAVIAGVVAVLVAAAGLVTLAFGFGSASMAAPGLAPNVRLAPQAPPPFRALPFLDRLDHTEMAARGILLVVVIMLLLGIVGLVVAITSWSPWNRFRPPTPRH
jgi:hypothetical protein